MFGRRMAFRLDENNAGLVFVELTHTAREDSGCYRRHYYSLKNRESKDGANFDVGVDIWGTAARLATACGKVRRWAALGCGGSLLARND